jgi:hypothetical protein
LDAIQTYFAALDALKNRRSDFACIQKGGWTNGGRAIFGLG